MLAASRTGYGALDGQFVESEGETKRDLDLAQTF